MRQNDLSPLLIYSSRDWLRLVALALLYALLAKISLVFATVGDNITLVWLPSGLALAALLLGGKRYWPSIFVGAWVANIMAGSSFLVSACIAIGNTLEPLLGAWLLSRDNRFDPSMTRYRDFLRLLFLAGIVSPAVSALNGVSILLIAGSLTQQMLPYGLLIWWMGGMLGIIIVAPTILVWRRLPQDWLAGRRKLELAVLFGLSFFSGQVIFFDWLHAALGLYAEEFLMFIWIVWGALRFGRHGVLLLLCMTLTQALLGTIHGVGYFGNDLSETGMVSFWIYFTELTTVGMTLALIMSELRQGEETLRVKKNFLGSMLENEPECVKVIDPKGNILEMNAAGLAMLDAASLGEAQQRSLFSFILPEYHDAFRELHRRVLQGERGTLEFEVLGLRGTRRWLEIHAAPLRDEVGKVACLLGITRDITARKQAEAELKERERQLSTLIGNLPGVVYRCRNDPDYTAEFISDGVAKMTGYPPDDFVRHRRQLGQLIHPDDRERVWAEVQIALQNNQPYELTFRFLTASGAEKWAWVGGQGVYDNHSQVLALEGFVIDITDRRRAEEELSRIFDLSLDMICTVNLEGYFQRLSPAFERVLGYSVDELRREPFINFVHPDDRPATIEEAGREKATIGFSNRYRAKDDSYRWLEWNTVPVPGEKIIYAVARDVTERNQVENALRESERRFSMLVNNLPALVYRVKNNPEWTAEYFSEGCYLITGYHAEDFINSRGLSYSQLIQPDDQQQVWGEVQAGVQAHRPFQMTYRIRNAQGQERWVWEQGSGVFNGAGELLALEGVVLDVTERVRAQERMRLAASIYEASTEAIMVTDENNCIIDINPAFAHITGYVLAEVAGKSPKILQSGRHNEAFYREMWREILNEGHWQGEIWDRRKDGEVYAKWMNISVIRHPDGSIHRYIAQFSDITEKKRKDELIWTQANYDALTGLPNRRLLQDRLEQDLIKARRTGSPLALLFIDLDRFKEINDTLGHAKGDVMLVEAARRIRGYVRESDTVARLGGDEFTVILSEFNGRPQIERITQHIIQELVHPFYFENDEMGYYISASIGISLYPDDATDLEGLLKHADQALYVAKAEGRSRFSYFTPSM